MAFTFGKNTGQVRLEVVDVTGKLLQTAMLPSLAQRYSLDLAGMVSGVYFLKMKAENGGEIVKRFVVAER
ncbi:MAG: T9SS type A sorting domain-containing protein [Saprospiraceae bacterium]|nr:T9SS type A sorting domain-containing protein [Saprospiraceae bacterium]